MSTFDSSKVLVYIILLLIYNKYFSDKKYEELDIDNNYSVKKFMSNIFTMLYIFKKNNENNNELSN